MSDLSEAANEVLNKPPEDTPRKRGRPKGSTNKPKVAVEADKYGTMDGVPFVYVPDPVSIMQSKALALTVWFLAAKMLPVRELTEEEGSLLGDALDPVLCKWLPMLGEWKYEMNLVVCIIMLYMATKNDKTVTPEMEVVPDATGSPAL